MLILTRNPGQKVVINGNVVVEISRIRESGQVQLAIDAPDGVTIDRWEIHQRKIKGVPIKK